MDWAGQVRAEKSCGLNPEAQHDTAKGLLSVSIGDPSLFWPDPILLHFVLFLPPRAVEHLPWLTLS